MTDPEHHGQAFGLCFRSNQPLPEMSPIASVEGPQAEVHIDWLPASPAAAPTGAGVSLHAEDSHFYLHMPEVARYQVGFDRITVALIGRADDRSVRAFLFGSAVGALLYRRGLTVLHGTTVELPDGSAAVFWGHSGADESTLTAALAARGYPVLADEVTAVRVDAAGRAWCVPGLARTKLWRDALDTLGLTDRASVASVASRVMPHIDKHALSMSTATRSAPLRRSFELQAVDGAELAFASVTDMAKVSMLMSHAYRPEFVQTMGLQGELLRGTAALAPSLRMARIQRPRQVPTLDAIIAWLEQQSAT